MARASRLIGFVICTQILVWGGHSNITLGTNSLTFGPDSGTGTVVVSASHHWKATTDSDWIHIDRESEKSENGTVSTLLKFTYDSNSGSTRTATIHFNHSDHGNAILTVTQAGADYIATSEVTTLFSRELSSPAFDASGNIYFTDYLAGTVKKWTAATGQVTVLVSVGLKNRAALPSTIPEMCTSPIRATMPSRNGRQQRVNSQAWCLGSISPVAWPSMRR